MVNEETFKHIYAQFFPHGGKVQQISPFLYVQTDSTKPYFCVSDARTYAHYLFNAFDTTNNGSIKFKVKECFHIYSHSHLFSDPVTLSFNLTCSFAKRTLSWGCLSCCVGHLRKSWSGHFTFMTLTRTDTSTER